MVVLCGESDWPFCVAPKLLRGLVRLNRRVQGGSAVKTGEDRMVELCGGVGQGVLCRAETPSRAS